MSLALAHLLLLAFITSIPKAMTDPSPAKCTEENLMHAAMADLTGGIPDEEIADWIIQCCRNERARVDKESKDDEQPSSSSDKSSKKGKKHSKPLDPTLPDYPVSHPAAVYEPVPGAVPASDDEDKENETSTQPEA